MKILKVFDGDYPWDVRVEKIVATLLSAGHQVRLLCRNQGRRPRFEIAPGGLEIARLPCVPAPFSFPLPFNPLWAQQIRAHMRTFRPDRILVRDLPLAPAAQVLGRRTGTPVVADLAEPYPDSLRSRREFENLRGIDHLLRNPTAADWTERWLVRRLDRALVVCREAGERLERQGLPKDRWTEVGNTPRLGAFLPTGQDVPELDVIGDRFTMLFSGLLAGDRGLEVAVEALAHLDSERPGRFFLVIIGEGPMRESLRRQAHELGIADLVLLPGFVDHHRLPDWIQRADVGLLPFHDCPHINSTLANKLFEYMSLALPVIASDVPPMRRILTETGAGRLFPCRDAQALADAVQVIEAGPEAARQLGKAGAEAVRSTYHWGLDEERLLAAVETAG